MVIIIGAHHTISAFGLNGLGHAHTHPILGAQHSINCCCSRGPCVPCLGQELLNIAINLVLDYRVPNSLPEEDPASVSIIHTTHCQRHFGTPESPPHTCHHVRPVAGVGRAHHHEVLHIFYFGVAACNTHSMMFWPLGSLFPPNPVHDRKTSKPAKQLEASGFEASPVV